MKLFYTQIRLSCFKPIRKNQDQIANKMKITIGAMLYCGVLESRQRKRVKKQTDEQKKEPFCSKSKFGRKVIISFPPFSFWLIWFLFWIWGKESIKLFLHPWHSDIKLLQNLQIRRLIYCTKSFKNIHRRPKDTCYLSLIASQ